MNQREGGIAGRSAFSISLRPALDHSFPDNRKENLAVVLIIPIARPVAESDGGLNRDVGTVDATAGDVDLNVELAQMMIVSAGLLDQESGQNRGGLRDGGGHCHGGGKDLRP